MAKRPSNSTHRPGAVKITGGNKKKGAGWLKWLLLLLLLVAIIIALVLLLGGGDDDGESTTSAASPTATATASPSATATPDGATAGANTDADAGSLTAAGGALTPGDGPALSAAVGDRAVGKGLEVVSVARGRGFWVGTSDADRTFVEYGSAVGTSENQTYKATVGDVVDFRGPVRPAPDDPAKTLKLSATDAKQLTAQGAYVNATTVTEG